MIHNDALLEFQAFDPPTRQENAYIMACCDTIHNMHNIWWIDGHMHLLKQFITHFEYR